MEKILIVVDMQNDFITGSLGSTDAQAIVPNVKAKVEEYKSQGLEVFFTQDTHFSDYLNTFEGTMLPIEHCIINTDGYEIVNELTELAEHSYLVCKQSFGYSNWKKTFEVFSRIEEKRREKINMNDMDIEICGLCTDICVISNALILRALFPNNHIYVDPSCCAGTTVDKHLSALAVMESCQIEII